jgi:signal transduction histidine kinase
MLNAPIPADDDARLAALTRFCVLDTPAEPAFDRLTRIAAHVLQVPTVLVSLIDRDRQWFKSRVGLDAQETPRDISFCGHAVYLRETLLVPDARLDPRFADNPLVTGDLGLRFYLGVPLITADGHALGTLCAIDYVARPAPHAEQIEIISQLADAVVAALELRLLARAEGARAHLAQTLAAIAEQAHQARSLQHALSSILHTVCDYGAMAFGQVHFRAGEAQDRLVSADIRYGAASAMPWSQGAGPNDPNDPTDPNGASPIEALRLRALSRPEPVWLADLAGLPGARAGDLRTGLLFAVGAGAGLPDVLVECYGNSDSAPEAEMRLVATFAQAQLGRLCEREALARMKDDFVHTVSHELRTPLTSICGTLELLEDGGELSARAAKLVSLARRNSERLTRLVTDMLDVAKIEAGHMAFDPAPQKLSALIERALQEIEGFAAPLGVQSKFQTTPEHAQAQAHVDADRFIQVLVNLLSNAVKFSPAGSLVVVGLAAYGSQWRVSVTDQGPGVAPAFRHRLFEKFAQADRGNNRRGAGTGLGLTIVKRIVEASGGQVSFEAGVPQGAVFHVDLPMWAQALA